MHTERDRCTQGVTIAPRNDGGGARRRIARRGDPSFYVPYISGEAICYSYEQSMLED